MKVDYWAIGFLWGSARFSGDHLLVQNRKFELIELAKQRADVKNEIFNIKLKTSGISWRLKINKKHQIVQVMVKLGYEGRKDNEERCMPKLNQLAEYGFLKGYFSTHYTLDRPGGKVRLRFYASKNILMKLNEHLNSVLGTSIKKIGNHNNNDVCKILYYQSQKEVPLIIDYLELV